MSFFTWAKNAVYVAESDVVAVIEKIYAEEQLAVSEVSAALRWIATNIPNLTTDIQTVLGVAQVASAVMSPQVSMAIGAANVAVGDLNKIVAAYNKGTGVAGTVVQGYSDFKTAQALVSTAMATVVSTKANTVPLTPAAGSVAPAA